MKQKFSRFMSSVAPFFACVALASCSDSEEVSEEGFEYLGNDGPHHFVAVAEEHWGQNSPQLNYGRDLCTKLKQEDYCDVYFWRDTNKPKNITFPIKRTSSVGLFAMRSGASELQRELQ